MQMTTQDLKERFSRFLEKGRYRKTPERFAILEQALAIKGHFGVSEIHEGLERAGYHVSRTTVYSTLELLSLCGLLDRHNFSSRQTRYEVALGCHVHLICSRCGAIREIEAPDLATMLREIDFGGFHPSFASTTVTGLCEKCSSDVGDGLRQRFAGDRADP